jgi:methylphosphotriester-DNA--protein-cysteine methyltransferase
MLGHQGIDKRKLLKLIRSREIEFAGNKKLKIYGMLNCKSGRKMKKENRVFFKTEVEAMNLGFRPCGHCMKNEFGKWKSELLA